MWYLRFMLSQRVAGVPKAKTREIISPVYCRSVVATGEPVRVRDSHAIKTHIFFSLQAFVRLELMRSKKMINNWYQLQRNLFTKIVREYVVNNFTNAYVLQYA